MSVRIRLALQTINLERMARELSQEVKEYIYQRCRGFSPDQEKWVFGTKSYSFSTELTSILLTKGLVSTSSDFRYAAVQSLVVKEMDRAKKRIKSDYSNLG